MVDESPTVNAVTLACLFAWSTSRFALVTSLHGVLVIVLLESRHAERRDDRTTHANFPDQLPKQRDFCILQVAKTCKMAAFFVFRLSVDQLQEKIDQLREDRPRHPKPETQNTIPNVERVPAVVADIEPWTKDTGVSCHASDQLVSSRCLLHS